MLEEFEGQEGRFIKDWLGRVISEDQLDMRSQEADDVFRLLQGHKEVILTSEDNAAGKSTFGRILRHKILMKPNESPLEDCLFMDIGSMEIAYHEPRRQRGIGSYDDLYYGDLVRFGGLVIFDEVFPEYLPLALSLPRARLLLVVQPNFLSGPPYDDEMHEDLDKWIQEKRIPIYKLAHFQV